MSESLEIALRHSVEEVLEKMFFIRSLGESESGAGPDEEICSRLKFEGRPSGCLTLCVAGPAARSISADFLGLEEEDLDPGQVGEVVCELANMICGSVLSRVGSAVTFRLAHPELADAIEIENVLADPPGSSAIHSVVVNGGSLRVTVRTELVGSAATLTAGANGEGEARAGEAG